MQNKLSTPISNQTKEIPQVNGQLGQVLISNGQKNGLMPNGMSSKTIGQAEMQLTVAERQTGLQRGEDIVDDPTNHILSDALSAMSNLEDIQPAQLKEILVTAYKTFEDGARLFQEKMTTDKFFHEIELERQELQKLEYQYNLLRNRLTEVCKTSGGKALNTSVITSLMFHYPQAYSTEGLSGNDLETMKLIKKSVLMDWAEDLQDFPVWAVKEACRQWRRSDKGRFRPTPSDMVSLCKNIVSQINSSISNYNPVTYVGSRIKEDCEKYLNSAKLVAYKIIQEGIEFDINNFNDLRRAKEEYDLITFNSKGGNSLEENMKKARWFNHNHFTSYTDSWNINVLESKKL